MEAYSSFAQVYEEWSRYLISLLKEYQVTDGTVVELGCGTGKMTRLLADAGYDMVGVDNSAEMLEIAGERQEEEERNDILYLFQDMQELELFGNIRAVVSVCDSMNYIMEPEDLKWVEQDEEVSYIWENYFYEDEMVNEYDLTLFIREESDLYRKYEELHYQKAYELEQVKTLLQQAGMEFMAAYDAFTHDPVTAESERMYIIARPKVI